MSFLKELLEKEKAASGVRETAYATLLSLVPTAPVMVNGEEKQRVLATIKIEGKVIEKSIFAEAISGRPSFIAEGGVECQATFKQNEWVDDNDVKQIGLNLIGLGIKEVKA